MQNLRNILLIVGILISLNFISCSKMDSENRYYPEGLKNADRESENDCSLPMCAASRIVRLKAKGLKGEIIENSIEEYFVINGYPIDIQLEFYFCDLPKEFQEDGLKIKFDADLIDACGIKEPSFGGQQIYFARIKKIKKI